MPRKNPANVHLFHSTIATERPYPVAIHSNPSCTCTARAVFPLYFYRKYLARFGKPKIASRLLRLPQTKRNILQDVHICDKRIVG